MAANRQCADQCYGMKWSNLVEPYNFFDLTFVDFFLAQQLEDSTEEFCTLNNYPGREWYCTVPEGGECGQLEWLGFEGRAWNFGEVLANMNLDQVYEQLAWTKDVVVHGLQPQPSNLIDGYWKEKKWISMDTEMLEN